MMGAAFPAMVLISNIHPRISGARDSVNEPSTLNVTKAKSVNNAGAAVGRAGEMRQMVAMEEDMGEHAYGRLGALDQ